MEKLKPLKREQWQLIEDLVDLWLKRKEEYSPSDQQDPFVEEPLEVYSPKLDYSPADLQAIADSYPKDTLWTHTLLQKVFPFEYRVKVQIINHKLYIMASPTETHQDITLDLAHNLKSYAIKHQLGKVIMGPYDTRLADNQLVQPDILFIALRR
ncbi:MAG: Uma2 family endonuclease, partial [Bacteroidota bacterium]